MNPLIQGFKDSAHLAGEICSFPNGKLIRQFGLGDFLENAIADTDDAPTIAVKALTFFCGDDRNPHSEPSDSACWRSGAFSATAIRTHRPGKCRSLPRTG
jgi:hypothetical protein